MWRLTGGRSGKSLARGVNRGNNIIPNNNPCCLSQAASYYILQQQQQHLQQQTRFFALHDEDAPKVKHLKVKKKDKRTGKQAGSAKEKSLEVVLAALDAPIRKEPPLSPEEKARRYEIGRQYNIGRMREHNKTDHDLTCKIYMKKHAITMLPPHSKIKEAALMENDVMPPVWRNIPVWTAPIPGFNPAKYKQKRDDE
jgi:hypothetical protein